MQNLWIHRDTLPNSIDFKSLLHFQIFKKVLINSSTFNPIYPGVLGRGKFQGEGVLRTCGVENA